MLYNRVNMAHLERVVVLVDMDCFYCQVEEKLNPKLKGLPIAVVQYNAWRGGGIIAVNYVAREKGVTRHMRGDEAQRMCPEIVLCRVPNVRGKADLTKFREGGKEVANVLQRFTPLLQRASIDEAYLDITETVNERIQRLNGEIILSELPNTHIHGCEKGDFLYNVYNENINSEPNLRLIVGGVIVEEIRAAVLAETGYTCSAGIAHNKILAKLSCGLNKPNKQTIVSHDYVPQLYQNLPIKKIRSLGGKFGDFLSEDLNITYMSELEQFSEKFLKSKFDEKNGLWLYNIARGIDLEPVTPRFCPKSIGCCKRFPGRNNLLNIKDVKHWIDELAAEVHERLHQELHENNREAKHMVVSFTLNINGKCVPSSKSKNSCSYDASKLASDAFEIIQKANPQTDGDYKYPITYLGISTGKFQECHQKIQSFFSASSIAKISKQVKLESTDQGEKLSASSNKKILIKNVENECNVDKIEKNIVVNNSSHQETFLNSVSNESTAPPNSNTISESLSSIVGNESLTEQLDVNTFTHWLCPECDQPILLDNKESHLDYHLALKVASSFHNEMPTNSQLSSANVLTKTNNAVKASKKSNTQTLDVFITKQESDSIIKTDIPTEICAQCQQKVPLSEFLDHLDYHEAKKLHKKINSSAVTVDVAKSEESRKKRHLANNESKVTKKPKIITNFFKPV